MLISVDDLSRKEIHLLLQDHHQHMHKHSPPESIHALDIDQLKKPDITFLSAWENNELLGIGALKEINSKHGEIKSMRTSTLHLRKGVAKNLLTHLIKEAQRRDYHRISLETGSMDYFIPAREMYKHFGFEYCPPFANYTEDPNSNFMSLNL